jgi:short subunit dehydrogenase-like uncharacterized protein
VLLSTVGPFTLNGEPVVRACVQQGTHYCDITGEMYVRLRKTESERERERERALQAEANSNAKPIDSCAVLGFVR